MPTPTRRNMVPRNAKNPPISFGEELPVRLTGTLSSLLPLLFHERELQLPLHVVDAIENHPHLVADGKLSPCPPADDLPDILLVRVLIARQRIDRDEPLDEQLRQFDE